VASRDADCGIRKTSESVSLEFNVSLVADSFQINVDARHDVLVSNIHKARFDNVIANFNRDVVSDILMYVNGTRAAGEEVSMKKQSSRHHRVDVINPIIPVIIPVLQTNGAGGDVPERAVGNVQRMMRRVTVNSVLATFDQTASQSHSAGAHKTKSSMRRGEGAITDVYGCV